MKSIFYPFIATIALLQLSCSTSQNSLFSARRSAHEKYSDGITDAGLRQTQLGNAWFAAAGKSLGQPVTVSLPYKESGYFAAERPAAAGYLFTAKRGEKIVVNLQSKPAAGAMVFAELWSVTGAAQRSFLSAIDSTNPQLQHAVEKDGQFILRLQPELLRTVEYTVTINVTGSLAFPVQRSGDPKIISTWGVDRDGGKRSHEGIDIAAKFRTPALAAADGYISRVNENALGGKVVFLSDANTGYSLYYAHLDSQIARSGQRVKAGDVVGLVGKTGNAINTVPHLHFGIYTNGGAIDPLAFIDNRRTEPRPVTASLSPLNQWLRATTAATVYETPSAKSSPVAKIAKADALQVVAATENWYKVELPGGRSGYVNSSTVTDKNTTRQKATTHTRLLESPEENAVAKGAINKGTELEVLGNYNGFYYTEVNGLKGWVKK